MHTNTIYLMYLSVNYQCYAIVLLVEISYKNVNIKLLNKYIKYIED